MGRGRAGVGPNMQLLITSWRFVCRTVLFTLDHAVLNIG